MDLEAKISEHLSAESKMEEIGIQQVSEEEAGLGRNALRLFQEDKFEECLMILVDLADRRPEDPRVLANLAVCKFFASGMVEAETLIESLQSIYQMIIRANGGGLESGQELEYSVLIYNLGIMAMDRRQFLVAEKFLYKLYQAFQPTSSSPNKEPKNESPLSKDDLLPILITLNLLLKNPTKAQQLIAECKEDQNQRQTLNKALALVQTKSYKAFKRDFKASEWSSGENQISYDFLKAQIEYVKGNAKKANKLLAIAMQQKSDPYLMSLFQNNLSCLHLIMKKPNLAVHYGHSALKLHLKTLKELGVSMPHYLLRIKKDEILYNLGSSLLHAGQPTGAFDTFLNASATLTGSPNYWLRLAECCINQQRKDEKIVEKLYAGPEWVHTKKVLVKDQKYKTLQIFDPTTEKLLGCSQCQPSLTLEFAFLCLENAEKLMSLKLDSNSESPNLPTPGASSPVKNGSSTRSHLLMLSIWANKSYILLHRKNYAKALKMAENILKSDPTTTPLGYKTLATMYAAEAQIHVGNSNEAMILLDPKKNFHDMTFTNESTESNTPNNDLLNQSNVAKTIFHINLAVALTMQGEVDKADDILNKLTQNSSNRNDNGNGDLSTKIFSLRLHLAFIKGNVEKARQLALKHYKEGHTKLT